MLTQAQAELAVGNLAVARKVAAKRSARYRLRYDDLIGVAMEALCDAARTWVPDRGCRFDAYAHYRCTTWCTRAASREVTGLVGGFERRLGAVESRQVMGDGAVAVGNDEYRTPDALCDSWWSRAADQVDARAALRSTLAAADTRVRGMVVARGMGQTYEEIGDQHGICAEGVRYHLDRHIEKMKKRQPHG